MDGSGAVKVMLSDCHGGEECEGIVLSGNCISDVYAPVVVGPGTGVRGASLWVASCLGDSRWRVASQAVSNDVNLSLVTLSSMRGARRKCCRNGRLIVRVDAERG